MSLLWLAACDPAPIRTYPVFVDTSIDEDDTATNTGSETGDTGGDDDDDDDTGVDPSDPVRIQFEGRVATVTGTPFGFDAAAVNATVSGFFTYDREVPDGVELDDDLSEFDHRGGTGPFTIAIDGPSTVFVAGSGNPVVSIDLFDDAFAWKDGPQPNDGTFDRHCTVDGVVDEDVEILLSLAPNNLESAFETDALPATFPFVTWDLTNEVVVTFTLEDDGDTLEIQLASVTEAAPQ